MTASDADGRYLRRDLMLYRQVTLFLSSGSDMMEQRNQFEELVKEVNDQLQWAEWPQGHAFKLHVVRWEQDASRKTGGDPNAEFRRQARMAHLTVVLLHESIRPGTLEELEAALQEKDTQLAVIWMSENRNSRKRSIRDLRRFLQEKNNTIIRHETGEPNSPEAWKAMVRVIARVIADVARPQADGPMSPQRILYEQR